jgi:APA family basic amino acid/polyamine antiporter
VVLRKNEPNAPRAFKTPLVPLIPILGVGTCLFMMVFLPLDTWIRLIVWMMIGFDVYVWYGMRHSVLSSNTEGKYGRSNRIIGLTGLGLVVLLIIVAFIHHMGTEVGSTDTGLFYFSLIFAVLHAFLYGSRLAKK